LFVFISFSYFNFACVFLFSIITSNVIIVNLTLT
jgi:hypothetical protein